MNLGGSKKIIVIAGVAVLVMGGFAGAFWVGKKSSAPSMKAETKKSIEKEIAEDHTKKESPALSHEKKGGEEKGKGGDKAEGKGESEEKTAAASLTDLTVKFKDFQVNLMNPTSKGVPWFLTVTISIKAATMDNRVQIEDNEAPLRDATITLLSSKTREEVETVEGKERIKRELRARYEGILGPGVIQDMYYGQFMVIRQ
jgi:flagellar protein FliL